MKNKANGYLLHHFLEQLNIWFTIHATEMDFARARSTKEEHHHLGSDSLESLIAPSEIDFEPKKRNRRSAFLLVYSLFVSLLVVVLL